MSTIGQESTHLLKAMPHFGDLLVVTAVLSRFKQLYLAANTFSFPTLQMWNVDMRKLPKQTG